MFSLSTPFWLSGLLITPLIWWLHRFQHSNNALPVSALFLWQAARSNDIIGSEKSTAAHSWWYRALICTLLIIALAGPQWLLSDTRVIHVWFDDSLSMSAKENNIRRYELAVNSLMNALQQQDNTNVTIHLLSQPGNSLALQSDLIDVWPQSLKAFLSENKHKKTITLPSPALMAHSEEHWLITDGSNNELSKWLNNAPVSRIINIGQQTENTAITGLSLRRSLTQSESFKGLLRISNQGINTSLINIEILKDKKIVQKKNHKLLADEIKNIDFEIDQLPDHELSARITTNDALEIDNNLSLPIKPLKSIATEIYGACGKHINAAIHAHPLMQMNKNSPTQLTINCSDKKHPTETPTIWLHPDSHFTSITATPKWSTFDKNNNQALIIKKDWISLGSSKKNIAGNSSIVLSTDKETLVGIRNTPQRIVDVFIDMENPALTYQQAYAMLINQLLTLALEEKMPVSSSTSFLSSILSTSRSAEESDIKPYALTLSKHNTDYSQIRTYRNLSVYFILLAGLLILLDWLFQSFKSRKTLPYAAAN